MGLKHKEFILSLFLCVFFILPVFSAGEDKGNKSVYKNVIFYVMEDSNSLFQIGLMDENGENKHLLTDMGNNWCPAVSPDGEKIAFYSDRSGYANLWLMDADGSSQKQLTFNREDIIRIDLRNRGQIQWSKESNTIYFLKKGDIWTTDKNGLSPSAMTGHHDITCFKFSPEKNRILFSREVTKRHNGIWCMEATGVNPKQIVESVIVNPAFDWGDDNVFVYYYDGALCTLTYYGADKKTLRPVSFTDSGVAWSKANNDRSKNFIAFIDDTDGKPNVWTAKPDNTGLKQITQDGGHSPFWAAGGKSLLFVEANDIYAYRMDSGEKNRLTYYFRSFYPVYTEIKIRGRVSE